MARKAYDIIARAAAMLKSTICQTPGARYKIRFADDVVMCAVRLTPAQAAKVSRYLDDPRHTFFAEKWEDDIHHHMAVAVAGILKDAA